MSASVLLRPAPLSLPLTISSLVWISVTSRVSVQRVPHGMKSLGVALKTAANNIYLNIPVGHGQENADQNLEI